MTNLKSRLRALIQALASGLVERDTAIRLALLAALAAEHLLLIGPPGTAKSELARRLHKAFRDASYFERLLTRFSVPEELFGPLSIAALEEDRYERQTAGFLPTASIAFIDEVFKANSAILNALLTLLNEREFDNGPQRVSTPLISVVGATNEAPQDEVVAAFFDRFLLRHRLEPVSAEGFPALIGLPMIEAFDVADELKLSRRDLNAIAVSLDAVELPVEVLAWLAELRAHLGERQVYVSDRRWRKIVRLLKTAAATNGRDRVEIWDLWLLRFCAGQTAEQAAAVAEWFERRLGVFEALDPERLSHVVQAFEAQLEIERNAHDLNYGEDGQLKLGETIGDAKGASLASRMSAMVIKRYGPTHIAARVAQVRATLEQIDDYLARLEAMRGELRAAVADHLWIDRAFAARGDARLCETRLVIRALRDRVLYALEGFGSLPRLPSDSGVAPEPIAV